MYTRAVTLAAVFAFAGLLNGAENIAPANASPEVRYVGSKICAACHMPIYRSFIKTAMGRSAAAMPVDQSLVPPGGQTVFDRDLGRYFQVFTRAGDVYQSEYALDANGSQIFRTTQKLIYVFGALENGNTYVVQRGDRLYEAPLTYYVRLKKWAPSPGYEQRDSGFSRAIPMACTSCHTGRANPAPGAADGTYQDPPFSEIAIGCERCHGPGELHVRAKSTGQRGSDPMIVNPAKLPRWLSDNICMNCHENGAARIVHPGKSPNDFRPGTPLDETVSLFADLRQSAGVGKMQVLSHYEGMIASECYRRSGKMNCTTCHDPHTEPASAFDYRSKCLTCHNVSSCTAIAASRRATTPADNCMHCHMPKEPITTIAHSALTDHRIIRKPGEPMPDLADAFANQTGLLHLNAVPGQDRVAPGILFRGLTEALPGDPSLQQKWGELLRSMLMDNSNDPYVLAQAGSYLVQKRLSEEQMQAGVKMLQTAVNAKVELPGVYVLLAQTLAKSGNTPGAVSTLQTGIGVDPSNPDAYRALIQIYAESGQFDKVADLGKRYLEEFPQDVAMRDSLRRVMK